MCAAGGGMQGRQSWDHLVFNVSNSMFIFFGYGAPASHRRFKGNKGHHLKLKYKQNKDKQIWVQLLSAQNHFSKKHQWGWTNLPQRAFQSSGNQAKSDNKLRSISSENYWISRKVNRNLWCSCPEPPPSPSSTLSIAQTGWWGCKNNKLCYHSQKGSLDLRYCQCKW